LTMGILSLASLISCSEGLPRIELCVDESMDPTDVKKSFGVLNIPVHVMTAGDLDAAMGGAGEPLLRAFAKSFFWGRKTAFTFGLKENLPVLYADLDVLWFRDPWTELKLSTISTVLSGTDQHHSFDEDVLSLLTPTHRGLLDGPNPVCAGLYAVGPAFRLPAEILAYIERLLEAGTPGHFCEQTLLALTVKLVGTQYSFERLPTCPVEKSILRPSYFGNNWIAAHYAGPTRPQFWRDAWSLLKW